MRLAACAQSSTPLTVTITTPALMIFVSTLSEVPTAHTPLMTALLSTLAICAHHLLAMPLLVASLAPPFAMMEIFALTMFALDT